MRKGDTEMKSLSERHIVTKNWGWDPGGSESESTLLDSDLSDLIKGVLNQRETKPESTPL